MTEGRSLLGGILWSSLVFAAFGAIIKLGNFLILPLYWRHLPPAEFGILTITELLSLGLLSVMTLALESGLTRFYHEWSEHDRRGAMGGIWAVATGHALALSTIALLVAWAVWDRAMRHVPFAPYAVLAIGLALARSFSTLPLALLRIQERPKVFAAAGLVTFAATSAAGLYLVIGQGMGVKGLLLGTLIGHSALAVFWIGFMAFHVDWRFRGALSRATLRYSLPLVPATLLDWLSSLGDRWFLDRFAPLHQIGLYGAAGRFSGVVKEGHQAAKNTWIPFAIRKSLENDGGRFTVARLSSYYVGAIGLGALAVALFAEDFLRMVAPVEYLGAIGLVPVLILAALADPLDVLSGISFSMANRTRVMLGISVMNAALALSLLGLMTWKYGAWGTAWGLVAVRWIMTIYRCCIAHRVYPMSYDYPRLAIIILLAVGLFGASLAWTPEPLAVRLAFKGALIAAFAVVTALGVLRLPSDWSRFREAAPS